MSKNKNAGVRTSKEAEIQNTGASGQPPAPASPAQPMAPGTFSYQAKLPSAPLGRSCTTLSYEGKLIRIDMTDGIYKFPEDMERGAAEAFLLHLQRLEFENASVIDSSSPMEKEPEKPKAFLYVAGHPENTKDKKVNATFSLEGYEKPFKCVEGLVKTTDKVVYEKLLAQGFYEVAIEEISDEEDGDKK